MKESFYLTGYGAGKAMPLGESTIDLKVDHARAVVVVLVVPDEAQTVPVLIGQPFTEQHHITMVKRKDTLTIFEEDKLSIDREKKCDFEIPTTVLPKIDLWPTENIIPSNYVGFVKSADTVMGQCQIGTEMRDVDALIRNAVEWEESTEIVEGVDILNIDLEDWIILAQRKDSKHQQIIDELTQEREQVNKKQEIFRKEYLLRESRLYRRDEGRLLMVIPKKMRWRIVKQYHDDKAYPSVDSTIGGIREKFWFARLKNIVKGYINSCPKCLFNKVPGGKKKGYLHPIDKIGCPYHTIHVDHLGPFVKSTKGNMYVLVAIDGFTKHVMLRAVKNTKSTTTCRMLREIITMFEPPRKIITDQGTTFTGVAFRNLCTMHNIIHIENATATPKANGHVERLNHILIPVIATMTKDPEGRDGDAILGQPRAYHGDQLQDEAEGEGNKEMGEMPRQAIEKIRRDQEKQPERYNKRRCGNNTLVEGELVLMKNRQLRERPGS
ncbi:hypothetical protein Trydic_g6648 [Trypoxylus dichotomus]